MVHDDDGDVPGEERDVPLPGPEAALAAAHAAAGPLRPVAPTAVHGGA